MANINGTDGNELILGTPESDEIIALAGDDTVQGGAEDDAIEGGDGNDILFGGTGSLTPVSTLEDRDILNGGIGDDLLFGNQGNDTLSGDSGNDTLFGGKDNDLIDGGEGNDVIVGDLGDAAVGGVTALDVVLLQDLSGSFSDDLFTLRSLAPDLLSAVQSTAPGSQFGLASFVDKPFSSFSLDYVYDTEQPLTTDIDALQTIIDDLDVSGGDDFPEAQLEALLQTTVRIDELGFRDDTRRIVVVSTDAPFHFEGDGTLSDDIPDNNGDEILDGDPPGSGEDYPSIEQVRNALNSSGIIPIFTVTADQIETYEELVEELDVGTVVELSSDSSNLVEAVTEGLGDVLVEDTLTGGAGEDSFFFYRPDDQVDQITDFESGSDQIVVLASEFGGGLVPGEISSGQFVIGTVAQDTSDRFIYDDTEGSLFFDPDGTGSEIQSELVILDGSPSLSAADLLAI